MTKSDPRQCITLEDHLQAMDVAKTVGRVEGLQEGARISRDMGSGPGELIAVEIECRANSIANRYRVANG